MASHKSMPQAEDDAGSLMAVEEPINPVDKIVPPGTLKTMTQICSTLSTWTGPITNQPTNTTTNQPGQECPSGTILSSILLPLSPPMSPPSPAGTVDQKVDQKTILWGDIDNETDRPNKKRKTDYEDDSVNSPTNQQPSMDNASSMAGEVGCLDLAESLGDDAVGMEHKVTKCAPRLSQHWQPLCTACSAPVLECAVGPMPSTATSPDDTDDTRSPAPAVTHQKMIGGGLSDTNIDCLATLANPLVTVDDDGRVIAISTHKSVMRFFRENPDIRRLIAEICNFEDFTKLLTKIRKKMADRLRLARLALVAGKTLQDVEKRTLRGELRVARTEKWWQGEEKKKMSRERGVEISRVEDERDTEVAAHNVTKSELKHARARIEALLLAATAGGV